LFSPQVKKPPVSLAVIQLTVNEEPVILETLTLFGIRSVAH